MQIGEFLRLSECLPYPWVIEGDLLEVASGLIALILFAVGVNLELY